MTVSGYHYAIKINDINKLQTIGDIFSNNIDKEKFRKKLESIYDNASDNSTPNQSELTTAFLKFINTPPYDLGISLYKNNFNPVLPMSQQSSNWKQVLLKNNNQNLDFKDCN